MFFCSVLAHSQCDKMEVKGQGDTILFFKNCVQGELLVFDTLILPPLLKDVKFKQIADNAVYVSWTFRAVGGEQCFLLRKIILNEDGELIHQDRIDGFCEEDLREGRTLREGNCIDLYKTGIEVVFEDVAKSSLFISYEELSNYTVEQVIKNKEADERILAICCFRLQPGLSVETA